MEEKVSKLEKSDKKGNKKYIANISDEEEDCSKYVQSQIVPGHLLKDMASKPSDNPISTNPGAFSKNKVKTTMEVSQVNFPEE